MIIRFINESTSKPVLEIINNKPEQVIIRFIPYKDEHVTIHKGYFKERERSGLLKTIYSVNKAREAWNEDRINIARDILHYNDPKRHGNYIDQSFLEKLLNVQGYFLIGKLIDLKTFRPKQKYMKQYSLEVIVPNEKFMLSLYLSTEDNPCEYDLQRIKTTLGEICFKVS